MEERATSWWVDEQIQKGRWREETVSPALTGLTRPLTVLRGPRQKSEIITHRWMGDRETFCPPSWADLAIGSGPCGLGCRQCFLLLTHRVHRDPRRHVLYDNLGDFEQAVRQWLLAPGRLPRHTLGIGIDRSDSLLYENVAPHIRQIAPLLANPTTNPQGCKLILLTKTANIRPLLDVSPASRPFILVTFSLNPQAIADLWEGCFDDGERIPPTIAERLLAARAALELGYEVRARVDPILWPEGWPELYADLAAQASGFGVHFARWTLGLLRQKSAQLDTWREKWGLAPLGWQPPRETFVRDGTHDRMPAETRIGLYQVVIDAIRREFPGAIIGLCKETYPVRRALGLLRSPCNCLP